MKLGAIFDLDGLMIDSEKLFQKSWKIVLERMGEVYSEEFGNAVCGTYGAVMWNVIQKYYPEIVPQECFRQCQQQVDEWLSIEVPKKPGVNEILQYFQQNGVRLAVASSGVRKHVEHTLLDAGLRPYFDVVILGEQVNRSKPEPDIFLKAAEELGLPAEDCYVFEDSPQGVRAGAAAGCTTVMIPDTTQPTEEVLALATAKFDSLTEALGAIQCGVL